MKSKFFLSILLLSLTLTAFAQQKKVAVYVTGAQSGVTKVLGDQLVAAFSKSSEYTAIERTSSFLAEISKEQSYQRTGAVDEKEISRLGKQFGVQYVCVADISEAFGKKYVSARLINVENAEIVSSANEYSDLNSMDELIRVSGVLKSQLLGNNVGQSTIPSGFVDLGLPSGTLWFKQSMSKMDYNSALKICESKKAQIPDVNQWTELQTECTWSKNSTGFIVKGRNGNTITLCYNGEGDRTTFGYFWTSTCRNSNKGGGAAVYLFEIDAVHHAKGGQYYYFKSEEPTDLLTEIRDVNLLTGIRDVKWGNTKTGYNGLMPIISK